ncbi:MAG: hypothetical protein RR296_13345, partial [Clostridia bacterium]
DEIIRIEEKVQQKTSFFAELQVDVDVLAESQTDSEAKAVLAALSEKIRYSDMMSAEALLPIEEEIAAKVVLLKMADKAALMVLSKEIELLLLERNKRCKMLK